MKCKTGFLVLWTERQFESGESITRMHFFTSKDDSEKFVRDHLSEDAFRPTSHANGMEGVFVIEADFFCRQNSTLAPDAACQP